MKKTDAFNPQKHYIDSINLCVHGHTPTIRYISNGSCVQCAKDKQLALGKERRQAYAKIGTANYKASHPSQSQVLITTLEAQIQFLQFDLDLPEEVWLANDTATQVKAQVMLIQKALAHKSGAKWVV